MAETESVVIDLPYDATAPAIARSFVADHGSGLPSELMLDAELLVSELVTNALRHGDPDITLQMSTHPPRLGVAVLDHGAADSITPRDPDPARTDGRGLMIVNAIASAWGVEPIDPPPGKMVWFELGMTTS